MVRQLQGWSLSSARSGLASAIVVLVLGAAGSWIAADAVRSGERVAAGQSLDRHAALAEATVRTEVGRYLDVLRSVAAAVGSYDRLTLEKFLAATEPFAGSALPGVTSVAFAAAATDEQVPALQQTWRHRGSPELVLDTVGTGREHLFSIMSRPLDGGPPLNGIDLSQSPEATQALNEARRAGTSTVSDAYILIRDRALPEAQRQWSFILTAPVRGKPDAGESRPFLGWILMGLRGQDFIGGVLTGVSQNLLNITLSAVNGSGQQTRVAQVRSNDATDVDSVHPIDVANRRWQLHTSANAARLPGGLTHLPTAIGAGLGTATMLLAGLILVLATGTARARAGVVAATGELRRAQQEERRHAGLLDGLVDVLTDGITVVNDKGEFLVHNPAARRILGIDHDSFGPDTWQEHYGIFRTDATTPFPAAEMPLVRALNGEPTTGVEMVIRNANQPDGVLMHVSGRPLDVGGQRVAVAVFRDITAERERERDMAAFAGMVAHDLRTPLGVVIGFADLASQALTIDNDPAEAVQALERVMLGADRMSRLIDALLRYTTAADAPLHIVQVDLRSVATDTVTERLTHLSGNDRAAPQIYVGDLPTVHADAALIRQVLDNLIGNALKFVPAGRPPRVDVSAQVIDDTVHVTVADRGIGIPAHHQLHVFDAFHRAHADAYAGTGLGLAICRRIIERHGGRITVADNPGGGTQFRFTLPQIPSAHDLTVPGPQTQDALV